MAKHTADLTNLQPNQGDIHRNEAVGSDYDNLYIHHYSKPKMEFLRKSAYNHQERIISYTELSKEVLFIEKTVVCSL